MPGLNDFINPDHAICPRCHHEFPQFRMLTLDDQLYCEDCYDDEYRKREFTDYVAGQELPF